MRINRKKCERGIAFFLQSLYNITSVSYTHLVAYAVQDSEGKNQIRVADVSSLQSEAVVGSEDYLSCYYAEGEELIYYSLADKRLIYRKGGQERTLGSDVQDVLVYPEDKIVVYRDAGENV